MQQDLSCKKISTHQSNPNPISFWLKIFNEINVVVNQIKEVDILSKESLNCSADVVSSINGVREIAKNAALSAQEVAASAEEQNTAMDSVVRASEDLAELGNQLQSSISIFKA